MKTTRTIKETKIRPTYIIRYLGHIKTSSNALKFVNLSVVTLPAGGKKKHYHGVLAVYDSSHQFPGVYDVGSPESLPDHIEGTTVGFTTGGEFTAKTIIDLKTV